VLGVFGWWWITLDKNKQKLNKTILK